MLLSSVARKDNAGDVSPRNPEIKYTNIVARVHLKQPRRAFFGGVCGLFEYNILYDAYVQQKLPGILFPVYIL